MTLALPADFLRPLVDVRGPAQFAGGIAEIRGKLAAIAQALGMKAAQ